MFASFGRMKGSWRRTTVKEEEKVSFGYPSMEYVCGGSAHYQPLPYMTSSVMYGLYLFTYSLDSS